MGLSEDLTPKIKSRGLWTDDDVGVIGRGARLTRAPRQVRRLVDLLNVKPRTVSEISRAFSSGTAYVYVCQLRNHLARLGVQLDHVDGHYSLSIKPLPKR